MINYIEENGRKACLVVHLYKLPFMWRRTQTLTNKYE